MAEISVVVFDIGNVLIEWVPERYFDQVLGAERRQEFFEQVPIIDANTAIDCGADFTGTLQQLALDYPQWKTEIRLWQDNWLAIVSPEIPRSVERSNCAGTSKSIPGTLAIVRAHPAVVHRRDTLDSVSCCSARCCMGHQWFSHGESAIMA